MKMDWILVGSMLFAFWLNDVPKQTQVVVFALSAVIMASTEKGIKP